MPTCLFFHSTLFKGIADRIAYGIIQVPQAVHVRLSCLQVSCQLELEFGRTIVIKIDIHKTTVRVHEEQIDPSIHIRMAGNGILIRHIGRKDEVIVIPAVLMLLRLNGMQLHLVLGKGKADRTVYMSAPAAQTVHVGLPGPQIRHHLELAVPLGSLIVLTDLLETAVLAYTEQSDIGIPLRKTGYHIGSGFLGRKDKVVVVLAFILIPLQLDRLHLRNNALLAGCAGNGHGVDTVFNGHLRRAEGMTARADQNDPTTRTDLILGTGGLGAGRMHVIGIMALFEERLRIFGRIKERNEFKIEEVIAIAHVHKEVHTQIVDNAINDGGKANGRQIDHHQVPFAVFVPIHYEVIACTGRSMTGADEELTVHIGVGVIGNSQILRHHTCAAQYHERRVSARGNQRNTVILQIEFEVPAIGNPICQVFNIHDQYGITLHVLANGTYPVYVVVSCMLDHDSVTYCTANIFRAQRLQGCQIFGGRYYPLTVRIDELVVSERLDLPIGRIAASLTRLVRIPADLNTGVVAVKVFHIVTKRICDNLSAIQADLVIVAGCLGTGGMHVVRIGDGDGYLQREAEENLHPTIRILVQYIDGVGTFQSCRGDHDPHSRCRISPYARNDIKNNLLCLDLPGIIKDRITIVDGISILTELAHNSSPAPNAELVNRSILQEQMVIPIHRHAGRKCILHPVVTRIQPQLIEGIENDCLGIFLGFSADFANQIVLGFIGGYKVVLSEIGDLTADAFMPVLIIIRRPLGRELVGGITLSDHQYVGIGYPIYYYRCRVSSDDVVGACALLHLFFHGGDNVLRRYVCFIMLAGQGQHSLIAVCFPRPLTVLVVVTECINVCIGVAVVAAVTIVDRITVSRTGCRHYGVGVNVTCFSIRYGIFFVTIIATVLDKAVYGTGNLAGVYLAPGVTCCVELDTVAMVAILTIIANVSAFRTGSRVSFGCVVVSVGNDESILINVLIMATHAHIKIICILDTVSFHVLTYIAVSIKSTSFSRCQSRYRVVREVVGLEGDVTVVIGSLHGNEAMGDVSTGFLRTVLILARIADEPDRNTVHVLALCQGIRKRDGYIVLFTKVGNVFSSVVNGKVINRAIAYLRKLILR